MMSLPSTSSGLESKADGIDNGEAPATPCTQSQMGTVNDALQLLQAEQVELQANTSKLQIELQDLIKSISSPPSEHKRSLLDFDQAIWSACRQGLIDGLSPLSQLAAQMVTIVQPIRHVCLKALWSAIKDRQEQEDELSDHILDATSQQSALLSPHPAMTPAVAHEAAPFVTPVEPHQACFTSLGQVEIDEFDFRLLTPVWLCTEGQMALDTGELLSAISRMGQQEELAEWGPK